MTIIDSDDSDRTIIAVGAKSSDRGGQVQELRKLSSIVGDDVVHISSGLGGDGYRIRYWFLVSSLSGQLFTKAQSAQIVECFSERARALDSRIESVDTSENYIVFVALVSVDTAVGELIEEGILLVNERENILREHYFVVNTHIPSPEEIKQYLVEIQNY